MNQELTQSLGLNLSKDPETKGFDLDSGQSWIYPTNYPFREYQFNIIQKALLKNTLVSLPTGLGKTFIAAVVMYNFYRWYPLGKVVFMAPTKPLVKQQIDACYDIMAIPKDVTAELIGTSGIKLSSSREDIWNEKRVFFITPQILQNDLEKYPALGAQVKCLVFDEAHRAKGNHAYCEVIRKLTNTNNFFRVLALSATPGSSINDVLELVQNLLISHLEFRTEESLDVRNYVFQRNLTTVVVPLGDRLQKVKEDYLQILEYYTRSLVKYKVIQGNCGSLTKGKIFLTMKDFQQKMRGTSCSNYAEIMKSLNICITLYHAFELLVRHGLRSFLSFFEEHIGKPLLRGDRRIVEIMNEIRNFLGPMPNIEQLPDGEFPEIPKDVKFGHPKFYRLRDILLSHFAEAGDSSRVIVFFEYRDSVMEAYALLIQSRPVLKPRIFVGQKGGNTQRAQINVVKAFREGHCNILLSTSIGEEGLDVGEVDLIVCFDVSNKSPIRMVQRMGRTGRKKEGSIVVLVTEGKEQQTLKDCLIHKNNIACHVLGSKELLKGLSLTCPRLVPEMVSPKCEKIFLTVTKPSLTKTSSLKEMFRSISRSSSSEPSFSSDLKIVELPERIPNIEMLWNKEKNLKTLSPTTTIYSKRIERQRCFQGTCNVKHSENTELLVSLLQLADSKRFNIPVSQIGPSSQSSYNKNFKQTDIRNLLFKSQTADDFAPPSTQAPKVLILPSPPDEQITFGSRELFSEISQYLSIKMTDIDRKCRYCPENMDCIKHNLIPETSNTLNWIELDHSVFTSIGVEDLKLFEKLLDKENSENLNVYSTSCEKNEHAAVETQKTLDLDDLIDKDILTDIFSETFGFQAPKTLDMLLDKYNSSIIINEEISQTKSQPKRSSDSLDLFESTTNEKLDITNVDNLLSFCNIKSLADIFNSDKDISSTQETIIYSPDIFERSPVLTKELDFNEKAPDGADNNKDIEGSPVLCTFEAKKKRLESDSERQSLPILNFNKIQDIASPSKFTMNNTKLSSTPRPYMQNNVNIDDDDESTSSSEILLPIKDNIDKNKNSRKDFDLSDICDVSIFDLVAGKVETKTTDVPTSIQQDLHTSATSNSIILRDKNFEDFCESPVLKNSTDKKKETVSDEASTSILASKHCTNNNSPKINTCPSPSQISVTQMLSLINKDSFEPESQPVRYNISQKENIDENALSFEDSSQFNFSFSINKTAEKKSKGKQSTCNNTSQSVEISTPRTASVPAANKEPAILVDVDESIKNLCLNMSVHSNPSDDEFDTRPTSSAWIKPKSKLKMKSTSKNMRPYPKIKKRQRLANQFIENEAELVLTDASVSEDEEETASQDYYEPSFVANETHNVNMEMYARYIQSVRSPVASSRFKIPKRRNTILNVYSQEDNCQDDTYLDDSFVVDEDIIESENELSELEILEKKLEEQTRKRKMPNNNKKAVKRKRIIDIDSSEEDQSA